MVIGPYVFGENRVHLWVAENVSHDKLVHFLPRLRNAIPNLTDLWLPEVATRALRDQIRAHPTKFFVNTWTTPHGRGAVEYALDSLAAKKGQNSGALELNIEGLPDDKLKAYVLAAYNKIRERAKLLPLRVNVVPFKGQYLPRLPLADDDNFHVIVQGYGGNMEIQFAADEVRQNLHDWGVPSAKTSVMHAVLCNVKGTHRSLVLPEIRSKGGVYIDDLLLDAGLL